MDIQNDEKVWHVDLNGNPRGPFSTQQIRNALKQNKLSPDTQIFGPGMAKWEPIGWNPLFVGVTPKPAKATYHKGQLAHEIDFKIEGSEMQLVEIELDPGEAAIAEAGSMMYMDSVIGMETIFGDGEEKGFVGNLVGAGKRLLTGESLFFTVFTNQGVGKKHVSFAAPYPGKIIPMNLAELDNEIICQKDAFLCAAKGVSIDIAFQKKIGVGLFGGEGFIMQRLTGDGLVFVAAGGSIVSRELEAGEQLNVDTGCIVALEKTVNYDIEYVGNIKSAIFGGEGLFYAKLTGPGTVWLQSLPFSRLAGRMLQAAPRGGGKSKGEGSLISSITNILE